MCKTLISESSVNVNLNAFLNNKTTPVGRSAAMHGVGAEDGLHQRSAGAQSDPAWRHVPEGGAGGEPEGLPEESSPSGGAGRVSEGETHHRFSRGEDISSAVECLSFTESLSSTGRTRRDPLSDPPAAQQPTETSAGWEELQTQRDVNKHTTAQSFR